MSLWSGTSDRAIYANSGQAIAGMEKAAAGDYKGILNRSFQGGLNALAGQQSFAYQGKTPLAAMGGVMGILDGIMGHQIRMQRPKYFKEGRGGVLGSVLEEGMSILPSIFGGDKPGASTASGVGLGKQDFNDPWVPPRKQYGGPTSTPFLGGYDY